MTDTPPPPFDFDDAPKMAWDVEREWQALVARRREEEVPSGMPMTPVVVRHRPWMAWGIAAAGVMVVMGGLGWQWLRATGRSGAQVYATVSGQRMSITLGDGTHVVLAPESRMQVGPRFDDGDRSVSIQGEGYFAVVHDAQHPFSVLTHNVQINDVGTEFDVRAYDDDIRVAVARGSVVVGAGRGNGATGYLRHSTNSGTVSRTRPPAPPNDPTFFQYIPPFLSNTPPSFQDILLSAGDMAEFANGIPMVTHHANLAALTAWQQGRLVFTDTPLREVARELERTFGLTVKVGDSTLAREPVTGSFGGQPIDDVLTDVTAVVGSVFERHGNDVVIRRRTVGSRSPVPALRAAMNGIAGDTMVLTQHGPTRSGQ